LYGWLDAAGAAFVTEDGVELLGATPPGGLRHRRVVDRARGSGGRLRNRSAAPGVPARRGIPNSGLRLAGVRLMRSRKEFVIWFRPELTAHTVEWAGDPRKPVQVDVVDGEARLTPRTSFALWKETVRGCSAPWPECELEAAVALRRAIAEVALVRMNADPDRSNAELDSFAYIASHDLKEPLRGISNLAPMPS
jgi:chemotaxis family two-component system sensor kinase Cph1